MPIVLELQHVAKSYGGLKVFDDVSLKLRRGTKLGVLGPNGAGKSTLFNLICALQSPTKGTITYNGRALGSLRAWQLCQAGIGRTFQIPQPFGAMSVIENIMVGCSNGLGLSLVQARLRAEEILHLTGLIAHANRKASELALLDLKRLELARAAALRPQLLLLDEIAGGLTEAECTSLLEILHAITTPDMTIIWIEHVVHVLTRFVEDIAVLADKRIVARGPGQEIFNNPLVKALYFGGEDGI